ncbi:hypothetical protein Clacol_000135 [Clathrus columnatus]|uniref:F-box domain-containing protein n=1 Tax=Clathrus columnatus TaxID=1419009 RepID=A0AAV4ZYK7_9AGAM|nr:hypothetical protein Clacol_000135 [Clathrus columnatus]
MAPIDLNPSKSSHKSFGEVDETPTTNVTETASVPVSPGARGRAENAEDVKKQCIQAATTDHLNMKERRNMLIPINRLPFELFTHIILLAGPSISLYDEESYGSYALVCRHWRSVLIHSPIFWRKIHLKFNGETEYNSFVQEICRRSQLCSLDITIRPYSKNSPQYRPHLEDLLFKESHRIRRIWVRTNSLTHLVPLFSNTHFPVLKGFSYDGGSSVDVLPHLVNWSRLETLRCQLSDVPQGAINQLGSVLDRLRSLELTIFTLPLLQSVLRILHNNVNLQELRLYTRIPSDTVAVGLPSTPTILSALQSLSTDDLTLLRQNIRAPNLSSLEVTCYDSTFETIPEMLSVSLIKYLYILDFNTIELGHCILGSTERVFFETSSFTEESFFQTIEDLSFKHDLLYGPCLRDCFRLEFNSLELLVEAIQTAVYPILPRMKALSEIYVLNFGLIVTTEYEGMFEKLLALVAPSVEIIVPEYDDTRTFMYFDHF